MQIQKLNVQQYLMWKGVLTMIYIMEHIEDVNFHIHLTDELNRTIIIFIFTKMESITLPLVSNILRQTD